MLYFFKKPKSTYRLIYKVSIMTNYTSIQISPKTRESLASLKEKRETYDDLINKFLELIPKGDDEGKYTDEFRISLLNARLDLKHNRTISHAQVKKSLGL